jgi:quinol monooxygenase YgiN
MEDTATASPADAAHTASSENKKCGKCQKRVASKGCVMFCCLPCCDDETCEKHLQVKEKQRWKEQILAGTTEIQKQAREKRQLLLHKKRFREPGFKYVGDTVVIWNINEYAQNAKWRDDAIRRSNRRKAREQDSAPSPTVNGNNKKTSQEHAQQQQSTRSTTIKPVRSSRKRFRRLFEQLYQESLKEMKSKDHQP